MKKQAFVGVMVMLASLVAISLAVSVIPETVGPIYNGPELDYQPSLVRVQPGGQLLLVFERLNPANYSGDLYVTFSDDDGHTWTIPQPIINNPALNERHPALVQLASGSFALFYLTDEAGYRLHRATSPDGLAWTPDPAFLDLGWPTSGEINPCVIREADGSLTMTYHRYGGPSYIARSWDDGATWDTLKTQVSNGNAPLPRLARRESDGLYIVSYQVNPGNNNLDIYAKLSTDPYDWGGPQIPISTDYNSHDSQPIVLEDGTLLVAYAKTPVYYFDLFYRTSRDGLTWSDEVQVTNDYLHYDTQPHPLLHGTRGRIILAWPHQDGPTPYVDHDVWLHTDLLVQPNLDASSKAAEPAVVAAGERLTYTLRLTNQALTTTAQLSDTLPLSTTYQAGSLWASSGDCGYDPTSRTVTWTGVISSDGLVTVTFRVDTDPGLADGAILTNAAWLSDGYGSGHVLVATTTVEAPALPAMFVGNIKLKYRVVTPGIYKLQGRVPIWDENLQAVPGATVTAWWTLPSGKTVLATAITRPNGSAFFKRTSPQVGVYSLTVWDVQAGGYVYDPGRNWETSEQISVP